MRVPTEGLARSVHTRLIRHAKEAGLDPTLVLARYGIERFLYRLSVSPHRDRFILKGALLLMAWLGETLRSTRDADLLGSGDLSEEALVRLFQSETHDFRGDRLTSAVQATFGRRGTPLPDTLPLALTPGFATEVKERKWRAFLGKGRLAAPESLTTVIQHLAAFLGPVLMDGGTSRRHWPAAGQWMGEGD